MTLSAPPLSRDRYLLFASSSLRACAVSLSGVILALYLAAMGFNIVQIGLTVSGGLIGAALATLAVIFLSRIVGRRVFLVALALLMALGGLAFAFARQHAVLIAFAVLGMVNGMGRDRGGSMSLEEAILPRTAADSERTKVFAWYNVGIDAGHAMGALLGALPALFRSHGGVDLVHSYRWAWVLYSLICVASACAVMGLSESVESKDQLLVPRFSGPSRSILTRFAFLSGLDSFGGGFLTTALIGFWFFKRFGVDESLLGPLFFVSRLANMFSHLAAAWLARRIGLVNTMVFTHLPSSLLLMTIPFMPNLTVAVILFIIRETLVEMDVPTRQSYLMAVMKPQERVRAAGVTNLTRVTAWGLAPMLAGRLGAISLSLPIFVGPGLKIIYDLLLYREFRKLKAPEESGG